MAKKLEEKKMNNTFSFCPKFVQFVIFRTEILSIPRNLALKEFEAKEKPDSKQVAFSIKVVTKNLVFHLV